VLAVRPARLQWALAALTVYLLALGAFTALGFRSDRIETQRRCDGVVRVVEIVGDEATADPALIERVVERFRAETDC
jgi:hypothetical protein